MYVLQVYLFPFEELLNIESKERLSIFFCILDLHSYAKELRSRSPRGTKRYTKVGTLRVLLAAPLEHINTFQPCTIVKKRSSIPVSLRSFT